MSAKAAKKSESARKSAEEKKRNLLDKLADLKVSIPKLTARDLIKKACQHYNHLASEREKDSSADPQSDKAFLDRITVNYLRHEMSTYEASLDLVYGKVGCNEARSKIRQKVYDAIAETYPELAPECKRQISVRKEREALLA